LSTRARPVYRVSMSDADKKARLAEALRANLRKRKAQAREQDAQTGAHLPSSQDKSSPSS
jgi:hypothetical protein